MSIPERTCTMADLQTAILEQQTRLEDQRRRFEARIEVLEATLAERSDQNGPAHAASRPRATANGPTTVSRAGLFKVAAAGAAGLAGVAVVDTMGAKPAQAAQGGSMEVGVDNTGATERTGVFTADGYEYGILADPGNVGILGSVGVLGFGANSGVYGWCAGPGNGVTGTLNGGEAVVSSGVYGDGKPGGYGVYGRSDSAPGVVGKSETNVGVSGASTAGRGAMFEGLLAPISLTPASTAGRPKKGAHVKGDIFVDKNAAIFICTKAGTPGKWSKVNASPV